VNDAGGVALRRKRKGASVTRRNARTTRVLHVTCQGDGSRTKRLGENGQQKARHIAAPQERGEHARRAGMCLYAAAQCSGEAET
jgi:hypothetical protein